MLPQKREEAVESEEGAEMTGSRWKQPPENPTEVPPSRTALSFLASEKQQGKRQSHKVAPPPATRCRSTEINGNKSTVDAHHYPDG